MELPEIVFFRLKTPTTFCFRGAQPLAHGTMSSSLQSSPQAHKFGSGELWLCSPEMNSPDPWGILGSGHWFWHPILACRAWQGQHQGPIPAYERGIEREWCWVPRIQSCACRGQCWVPAGSGPQTVLHHSSGPWVKKVKHHCSSFILLSEIKPSPVTRIQEKPPRMARLYYKVVIWDRKHCLNNKKLIPISLTW